MKTKLATFNKTPLKTLLNGAWSKRVMLFLWLFSYLIPSLFILLIAFTYELNLYDISQLIDLLLVVVITVVFTTLIHRLITQNQHRRVALTIAIQALMLLFVLACYREFMIIEDYYFLLGSIERHYWSSITGIQFISFFELHAYTSSALFVISCSYTSSSRRRKAINASILVAAYFVMFQLI